MAHFSIKNWLVLLLILLTPWSMGYTVAICTKSAGGSNDCVTAGCTGTYKLCWTGDYSGDTDKGCINSGATTKDGTVTGLTINATYGQSGNGALADTTGDRILYTRTGSDEINTDEGTMKCAIKVPSLSSTNYLFGTNYDQYSRIVLSILSNREIKGWHVGSSGNIVSVVSNNVDGDCASSITVPTNTWTNVYLAWSKSSNQIAVKIGANNWCNDGDSDSVASLVNAPTTVGFGDVGSIGLVDYYYMDDCKVSGTYKDASL